MRRWILVGLGAFLALVLVVRLLAPIVALRFVNDILATLPDYDAHAADVDLEILSGNIVIRGLEVVRPGVEGPHFLDIDAVVVHPLLQPAMHGEHILDLDLFEPHVAFVVGPDDSRSQLWIDPTWVSDLLRRFPATIDRLGIARGEARYIDESAKPKVDLTLDHIAIGGTNLSNLAHDPKPLFGHIAANAQLFEEGKLEAVIDLDPYAESPHFALQAKAASISLPALDAAFRAYGHFDVEAGSASGTMSLTASGGGYKGVADPVIAHLEVVRLETDPQDKKNPLRFVWESLIGTVANVASVATPGTDRIELHVPLQGRFDDKSLVLVVLKILPRAWFGTLLHALEAATASGKEAAQLIAETVPIAKSEKADSHDHRRR